MPSRSSRAGGMGMVTWDRNLGDNLQAGDQIFMTVLASEFEAIAREMEAWARANHPWSNRTGRAEREFTVKTMNTFTIVAYHGAPYGKWLEWRYGGKYGVIPATLDFGRGLIGRAVAKAWMAAWRFP